MLKDVWDNNWVVILGSIFIAGFVAKGVGSLEDTPQAIGWFFITTFAWFVICKLMKVLERKFDEAEDDD